MEATRKPLAKIEGRKRMQVSGLTVAWHGTDARGRTVPEGAYFVRLFTDDKTLTTKLVKLD